MRRRTDPFQIAMESKKKSDEEEYLRKYRTKMNTITSSYFENEDDEEESKSTIENVESDEVDPLDAFMQRIDNQVEIEKKEIALRKDPIEKPAFLDEDNDPNESLLDYLKEKADRIGDKEYKDSDDEVYGMAEDMESEDHRLESRVPEHKKEMEVLAPLDHTKINYEPFRKNFYVEHQDVTAMSHENLAALRNQLDVKVHSAEIRPIQSFMHAGFDERLLKLIMKHGLEAPTPIQCQALPIVLSGRDVIGIAKTGSGKTLAFVWPMLIHVMDQRVLEKGEGPIALVLSPTRELAHQIYVEAKKFAKAYGIECAAIYGGAGKWEQIKALNKGCEVAIATPGRMIDMIKKKEAPMNRVTFLTLDEADRMFDMGFEPQVRSIIGRIRPDRQTLLFSATFRKRVEGLAKDVLENPVRITVGKIGKANEDIRQIPIVLQGNEGKWNWLIENLGSFAMEGKVLVFVSSKVGCEELCKNLNNYNHKCVSIHGDKDQNARALALKSFKTGEVQILVATDVAARGLDIKEVQTVVNFDTAKNIETHIHRIGRTGRMGVEGIIPGTAYTLITHKETQAAGELVHNLQLSGQLVPPELLQLAKKHPQFTMKYRGGGGGGGDSSYPFRGNGNGNGNPNYSKRSGLGKLSEFSTCSFNREIPPRGGSGGSGTSHSKGMLASFVRATHPDNEETSVSFPPQNNNNSILQSTTTNSSNKTADPTNSTGLSFTTTTTTTTDTAADTDTTSMPTMPTKETSSFQDKKDSRSRNNSRSRSRSRSSSSRSRSKSYRSSSRSRSRSSKRRRRSRSRSRKRRSPTSRRSSHYSYRSKSRS